MMTSKFPVKTSIIVLWIVFSLVGCNEKESGLAGGQSVEKAEVAATRKLEVDNARVLATVNGKPIYEEHLEPFMSGPEPMTWREALDELIGQTLLEEYSFRKGYGNDGLVESERRKALAKEFIDKEVWAFTGDNIPEDRLREQYNKNMQRFVHGDMRGVTHALVFAGKAKRTDSESKKIALEIAEAVKEAKTGEEFKEAASSIADQYEGTKIEPLPPFDANSTRFVKPFVDGAFSINLEKTRVSVPVKTKFGWHVIFVLHEYKAEKLSFEKAIPILQKILLESERERYAQKLIKEVETNADLFIYDIAGESMGAD